MKIKDLDYFRTKDNIFFLVKGYYHPIDKVFAYPIFWPDKNGNRYHYSLGGRFKKETSDINNSKIFELRPNYKHDLVPINVPLVPLKEIIEIYHPKNKIKEFLNRESNTIWFEIFNSLSNIGKISKKDIGIFGSYLINLSKTIDNKQAKDIDFVVYGIKNCIRIKNNFEDIINFLGYSHISKKHIAYHEKKFGSDFNPKINSFKKTLARKWSAIQINEDLLATIRFVYKDNEKPPNPIKQPIKKAFQIKGKVIDDFGTNFMPRTFKITNGQKKYLVVTYFWGFQQAVKNNDSVLITGNLHKDRATISVDSIEHGIKILN